MTKRIAAILILIIFIICPFFSVLFINDSVEVEAEEENNVAIIIIIPTSTPTCTPTKEMTPTPTNTPTCTLIPTQASETSFPEPIIEVVIEIIPTVTPTNTPIPTSVPKPIVIETDNSTVYEIPNNHGFKSYMPHTVFNKKSVQNKLQTIAYTGDYGIRMVEGRYCVAVGTHFGLNVGQCFDLVLANGTVIPCVLGDMKADKDTDSNNIITTFNGCCSEFVVDMYNMNSLAKRMGDMSYACDEWNSPVVKLIKYKTNVLE